MLEAAAPVEISSSAPFEPSRRAREGTHSRRSEADHVDSSRKDADEGEGGHELKEGGERLDGVDIGSPHALNIVVLGHLTSPTHVSWGVLTTQAPVGDSRARQS